MLINKATYDFRDLVQQSRLSERNVRYYLYELKLRSEEGGKGRQRYTKPIRDKLVFIGMLREQAKKHRIRLSVEGIRQILEDAASSIEAVADGLEPLEIFDAAESDSNKIREKIDEVKARGEEVMPINMSHIENKVATRSAKEYIRQHKDEFMSGSSPRASAQKGSVDNEWKSLRLGGNVRLRVRGNYSQKTMDQLALLGPLVESILKEDKSNG